MSFLTQIRIGAWISKWVSRIFRSTKIVSSKPKFKKGDLIGKARPSYLEDWEIWDGSEAMEVLDIGRSHYKVWYRDADKFKSTYSKLDLNGEKYSNWPIESTDREYVKIGVSTRGATYAFDSELSDLIGD
jgi:hypothetical protein